MKRFNPSVRKAMLLYLKELSTTKRGTLKKDTPTFSTFAIQMGAEEVIGQASNSFGDPGAPVWIHDHTARARVSQLYHQGLIERVEKDKYSRGHGYLYRLTEAGLREANSF